MNCEVQRVMACTANQRFNVAEKSRFVMFKFVCLFVLSVKSTSTSGDFMNYVRESYVHELFA